jgi:hypothetical protein
MRKRPTAKKATKKKKTVTRKSRATVKRRPGRAAGFVDTLRSAKDRLARFYDENKDALKIAGALATTAGLGYGAYRLANPRPYEEGVNVAEMAAREIQADIQRQGALAAERQRLRDAGLELDRSREDLIQEAKLRDEAYALRPRAQPGGYVEKLKSRQLWRRVGPE